MASILDPHQIRDEELFSALARQFNWYGKFHHFDSRWCSLRCEPRPGRNVHYTGPEGKAGIWELAKGAGIVSGAAPDFAKR